LKIIFLTIQLPSKKKGQKTLVTEELGINFFLGTNFVNSRKKQGKNKKTENSLNIEN
jgi:hypothetical protein